MYVKEHHYSDDLETHNTLYVQEPHSLFTKYSIINTIYMYVISYEIPCKTYKRHTQYTNQARGRKAHDEKKNCKPQGLTITIQTEKIATGVINYTLLQ